jgi:16S rRNA (cytosine1402-N4)-methyltransferase
METKHDSVLFIESIEGLALTPSDIVVDGTLGGAGHFKAMYDALGPDGVLIGIDADADAIARAQSVVDTDMRAEKPIVHLVLGNFRNLDRILDDLGVEEITKSLFDLGWSSFQLTRGRGFSFKEDEPLHMTYGDPAEQPTASDLVNSSSEEELADIIYIHGEERFARGIAKAIVTMRKKERIETTAQLVEAVMAGTPAWYHHRRLHPATKTFQALRIAVNDELGALRDVIETALTRTKIGGRVAIITFHSIEDRIVKGEFRDSAHDGKGTLVNRKPIGPSEEELERNPRARSAKLRIFERGCVALTREEITNAKNLAYA